MKRKLWLPIIIVVFAVFLVWFSYHYFVKQQVKWPDTKEYPLQLDSIRSIRHTNKHADHKTLKTAFENTMLKRVFPYWYGTSWDFTGTTETPRKGHIACGYFVTTTLQHAGVKLHRVKLAQCASEEMIRQLVAKENIHYLSQLSMEVFVNKLKHYGNGLYIIGLDNHTGFIWIDDNEASFIHASGWFPREVVKEALISSSVIQKSAYRVVGKISDDEAFLNNWVK